MQISRIENRTPIILIEVAATKTTNVKTVLLYGHCDKQPPLTEKWAEGLHPYPSKFVTHFTFFFLLLLFPPFPPNSLHSYTNLFRSFGSFRGFP